MNALKNIKLTHETLCELLSYDQFTGIFRWKKKLGKGNPGDIAGSPDVQGYIRLMIRGERFLAHRLAWFYHFKKWPENQIDHISLIKSDNRIENLREATGSQNQSNKAMIKSNTSGFKGVSIVDGKFLARIKVNRKLMHLGTFMTGEDAHEAYVKAANDNFGDFARVA